MSDDLDLDRELDALAIANWGLIHNLEERRQRLSEKALKMSYEAFRATDQASRLDAAGYTIHAPSKGWWGCSWREGSSDFASTWISVRYDEPRMSCSVYTAFKGAGNTLGYRELKDAVATFSQSFAADEWDTSGQRSRVVTQMGRCMPGETVENFAEKLEGMALGQMKLLEALTAVVRNAQPQEDDS